MSVTPNNITHPRQRNIPHGRNQHYPGPASIDPDSIPPELRTLDQWANWHRDKVIKGSSINPATWTTFDAAHRRDPRRLVFVFTRDDRLAGIDLDHCRDPKTGAITPEAWATVQRFPHLYWEISLSGTGLHGIGYGALPEDVASRHPQGIGIKQHSGYFVMTGNTIPGYETMGAFGDDLTPWYLEHFTYPNKATPAAPVTLTMDDHDIVERLRNEKNGKAARLLDGDKSGYPDYSTARFVLANKVCMYTDDPEQVARILRSSGLFKDEDSERERDRKAANDARKTVAEYSGPRYDPNYRSGPQRTIVPNTGADSDALSCTDVRKELAAAQAIIAEKDAHIVRLQERLQAAEEKVQRLSFERSQSMEVLRAPDLNPGQKLTHFAQVIDLGARIANGEEPTPAGFRQPAMRIAEMTGQKVKAVRRHRNELADRGIIDKVNVREQTEADTIDPETGEILTATGTREVTHIRVPESNIINLIIPAIAYARPDDAPKRGGKRTPKCQHHPDAGTITTWVTECVECHAVLEQGETYREPMPAGTESSGTKLDPDPHVVNTVYREPISGPETLPLSVDPNPDTSSHANFDPEPSTFTVPADFWDDSVPPPLPGPKERARIYGQVYRGETA